jgi:hypothetical protein
MKKMGDLMQEMGFRKDAPDSVKEAFLKHLIKSATGVDVVTPSEKAAQLETKSKTSASGQKTSAQKTAEPIQLEFGFFQDESQKKAKVS